MSEFSFKEIDVEGLETLDVIAEADKFNRWMYDTIRPYCKGGILEIGSGTGNISQFFINEFADITVSDIRSNYCGMLKHKFPEVREVIQLDLTHANFDAEYRKYLGQFDSLFALNVVEHIKDHELAIGNCYKLLKSGGKLVILVPAYQNLYNRFDTELEHFRRYNRKSLTDLFIKNQLNVIHSQYFNFIGILGWFVSGKIQKNRTIPKNQMSIYNKLVPIFKLVDAILLNSMGLSVIAVGEK
jgi:SAM-dependent methyltransferase